MVLPICFHVGLDFMLPLLYLHASVEEWPSGQWQQTVNLPSYEYAGSNPASSTIYLNISVISQCVADWAVCSTHNPTHKKYLGYL